MFNFFKSGTQLKNLERSLNVVHVLLKDITSKLDHGSDSMELSEDVMFIAYILKKGVYDQLNKNKWRGDSKIFVPKIDKEKISLENALAQTSEKINILAFELGIFNVVQEITGGGNAYDQVDKKLLKVTYNTI